MLSSIIEIHLHLIEFERFLSTVTNRFNSNTFTIVLFALLFLRFGRAWLGNHFITCSAREREGKRQRERGGGKSACEWLRAWACVRSMRSINISFCSSFRSLFITCSAHPPPQPAIALPISINKCVSIHFRFDNAFGICVLWLDLCRTLHFPWNCSFHLKFPCVFWMCTI